MKTMIRKGLFQRIFLSILVFILIAIVLLAFVNYNLLEHNMKRSSQDQLTTYLEREANAVENVFNSALTQFSGMMADEDVAMFFDGNADQLGTYGEGNQLERVRNSLDLQRITNPYVTDVWLYSFEDGQMASTQTPSHGKIDEDQMALYLAYMSAHGTSACLAPGSFFPGFDTSDSFLLVHYFYYYAQGDLVPDGMVVVQMDRTAVLGALASESDHGRAYLADENGALIAGQSYENEQEGAIGSWLVSDPASQITSYESDSYLYLKTDSQVGNWRYIASLSSASINANIAYARNVQIVCAVALGVVLAILSYLAVRAIYRPVRRIYQELPPDTLAVAEEGELAPKRVDELDQISHAVRAMSDMLKSAQDENEQAQQDISQLRERADSMHANARWLFFRKLLHGTEFRQFEMEKQAEMFSFPLDAFYCIVMVRLNAKHISDKEFTDLRWQSSAFQQRIGRQMGKCFADNHIALHVYAEDLIYITGIACFDKASSQNQHAVQMSLTRLAEICHTQESMEVHALISDVFFGVEWVSSVAKYLRDSFSYRFAFRSQVQMVRDISSGIRMVNLDSQQSKLHNAVSARNVQAARAAISEIYETLCTGDPHLVDYQYHCRVLLGTILQAMQSTGAPKQATDHLAVASAQFERMFVNVGGFFEWVDAFVGEYVGAQPEQEGEQENPVVEYMRNRIKESYNTDIALGEIADELKLSEPYLSKLFKEAVGVGFKEYLTRHKMGRAKEILCQDNVTVAQVAQEVGYNNAKQFVRIFKKYEGVTPSEYRAAKRIG